MWSSRAGFMAKHLQGARHQLDGEVRCYFFAVSLIASIRPQYVGKKARFHLDAPLQNCGYPAQSHLADCLLSEQTFHASAPSLRRVNCFSLVRSSFHAAQLLFDPCFTILVLSHRRPVTNFGQLHLCLPPGTSIAPLYRRRGHSRTPVAAICAGWNPPGLPWSSWWIAPWGRQDPASVMIHLGQGCSARSSWALRLPTKMILLPVVSDCHSNLCFRAWEDNFGTGQQAARWSYCLTNWARAVWASWQRQVR